jgi:hypothetical protein
MPRLKNCPFCGVSPWGPGRITNNLLDFAYGAGCNHCNCIVTAKSIPDVVRIWNNRPAEEEHELNLDAIVDDYKAILLTKTPNAEVMSAEVLTQVKIKTAYVVTPTEQNDKTSYHVYGAEFELCEKYPGVRFDFSAIAVESEQGA